MLHRSRTICLAFALAFAPAVILLAQDAAAKAYLGTWKLNVAKSKFDPGPGPKEVIRIHEDAGGGQIRVTTKTVGQDGSGSTTYTYRPDGKDVPITGGRGGGPATISITAVDPYTVTYAQKLADGKTVNSGRRVVSKDGKTMTITGTGTNAKGMKTSSTQVFEKQ